VARTKAVYTRSLAAMQPPHPAPTAQGVFSKTPFPHLIVYALERRLTGSLELHVGPQAVATIVVVSGLPAKVRTVPPLPLLGEVMVELGLISPEQREAALARLSAGGRLFGQVLLELGAIDGPRLEAGVRAQIERRLEHLFAVPPDATFTYFDGVDRLQGYGGPPLPIDPLAALWRGVRQVPAWEHVDLTLRRLGNAGIRLLQGAGVERCGFIGAELRAIDLLRERPLRVLDLAAAKILGAGAAQVLVYFLLITKQVELVDAATMAASVRPPEPAPVARVQLQPRQITRSPLVVEEVAAEPSANDGRVSSPNPPIQEMASSGVPSAPISVDVPVSSGPMDIGAMIASSLPPPPIPGPPPEAIPLPPGIPAIATPSPMLAVSVPTAEAPVTPARLTVEQNALKAKILERADQITSQNYFQMLGLGEDASSDAVQRAFVGLAKVWHPDRLPAALADVKDACSKVFSHLTSAHATLTEPKRRQDYMTLLKEGGATPDDQVKIQNILEAATEFQKAEILLKRNGADPQAYDLVKRATSMDPDQVDYIALLAWLDAQKPEWLSREKTLEKVAVLDGCIRRSTNCERAYFYRGMLYKRIDESRKAVADFKKVSELNPRNLDAIREVRLHNMRGGSKGPPPPGSVPGVRASKPEPGGLFGKLFKK
jgi:DnaJ-like protein